MLLKEEWVSTAGYLESAINAILVAGDDLMNSRALQVSIHWKLHIMCISLTYCYSPSYLQALGPNKNCKIRQLLQNYLFLHFVISHLANLVD